MTVADLPHLNAALNTLVSVLLVAGLLLARSGRGAAHRAVMVAALVISAVFLASYLTYHYQHGSTRFTGQGWIRPVYFAILVSHTILAVVNLPFILTAVVRAARGDIAGHRRVARLTWLAWFYVAVTGPVVYLMLYRMPGNREVPAPSAASSVLTPGLAAR
jgi:putative membrane protein